MPIVGRAGDGEDPVKWLTDLDEACKLATDEDRPLMLLFTNRDLETSCNSCRFAPNTLRRMVRESEVVPVKLMPPVALGTGEDITPEEAAKRAELYKEAQKRYADLIEKYGARKGPCLVFTASDCLKLTMLEVPSDDAIADAMARLDEMLDAHDKLAGGGKDAGPDGGKPADPGDGGAKPGPENPAKDPEGPKGGEDDF